jgi:hypothetical protein
VLTDPDDESVGGSLYICLRLLLMIAFPTPTTRGLGRTETSLECALEIDEDFTLRVLLDEGGGPLVSGKVIELLGLRLIAQVSAYMKPDTCVQIDCDDALLQGEILGCWREGPVTFAGMELLQALTGLKELAKLREEHWDSPKHLKPEILQMALV